MIDLRLLYTQVIRRVSSNLYHDQPTSRIWEMV